jgi:hypothetical protein
VRIQKKHLLSSCWILEVVLIVSPELLMSSKFAAAVALVVGSKVDLEVEFGVVLETTSFDDPAVVDHPQHYCSEEG